MPSTPPCAFNFLVEIDGMPPASFSSCSGLGSATTVVEFREGSDPQVSRPLAGVTHYSPVVLTRGITGDRSLWLWRRSVEQGQTERRTVRVTLRREDGTPVASWTLHRAWPAKWVGPDLNATGSEVAVETLELVHEGLEWEEV
jgi:phage tail-like protein